MTPRILLWASILVLAAVGGWSVGRQLTRPNRPMPPPTVPWNDSIYEAHTSFVDGPLSPETTAELVGFVGGGPAALVALDSVDLRNCGDLGRQLRELLRVVPSEVPFLVTTSTEPDEELERFLRSERLGSAIPVAIDMASIGLDFHEALPKPAVVWLNKDLTYGFGVGHRLRYPYVRTRSFAQELAPHYEQLIESRQDGRTAQGYTGEPIN